MHFGIIVYYLGRIKAFLGAKTLYPILALTNEI